MNRSIRVRIRLTFLGCALCVAMLTGLVYWNAARADRDLESIRSLDRVNLGLYRLSMLTMDLLHVGNPRTRQQWERVYQSVGEEMDGLQLPSAGGGQLRQELRHTLGLIGEGYSRIPETALPEAEHQGMAFILQMQIARGVNQVQDLFRLVYAGMDRRRVHTQWEVTGISALLLVLVGWSGMQLQHLVIRPLLRLRDGLRETGRGNLAVRLPPGPDNEFGEVTQTFNLELEHLQELTISREVLHEEVEQRRKVEAELREALSQIRTLHGVVPICSHCKKIRDDQGYWQQVENYVRAHTDAEFTHGMCPECLADYMKDLE